MPTNNPRFTFTISQALLDRVDEFRFKNRFRSQTKAITALIELGLDSIGDKPITPSEPPLKPSDARLLSTYHAADKTYQTVALELLESHPAAKKENRA